MKPAKSKIEFADLPTDFAGLCRIHTPRPIHDKSDYANTVEVTDAMAAHAERFSDDQEDYFEVLCILIEKWDAENVKWKKVTPRKLLQHLLDEHQMNGADLSRVLGASSRHLGAMILRGEREITADHARALGKHFGVPAGVFIE
jgi:HTH-type transcriptional regulator/antitoxin HigA